MVLPVTLRGGCLSWDFVLGRRIGVSSRRNNVFLTQKPDSHPERRAA
jgi:hypothetical protein